MKKIMKAICFLVLTLVTLSAVAVEVEGGFLAGSADKTSGLLPVDSSDSGNFSLQFNFPTVNEHIKGFVGGEFGRNKFVLAGKSLGEVNSTKVLGGVRYLPKTDWSFCPHVEGGIYTVTSGSGGNGVLSIGVTGVTSAFVGIGATKDINKNVYAGVNFRQFIGSQKVNVEVSATNTPVTWQEIKNPQSLTVFLGWRFNTNQR